MTADWWEILGEKGWVTKMLGNYLDSDGQLECLYNSLNVLEASKLYTFKG